LRATAVAYEVVTRVARAFTPADDGIHSHANYSAIGACAATASARRLDAREFCDALSSAFTFCFAGPRNHVVKGALVRNTWPALGAWSGMMSVEWARCGIAGLAESAYDALVGGLHATAHPDRLTADLGRQWAVLDGYTKIYACCQHAHSAAEAVLELRRQLPPEGALGQIERIVVETHRLALKLTNAVPATTLAAKFSLPHIVAAALTFGEAGARAFFSDTLAHSGIAELRGKISIAPYLPELAPPHDRSARVYVHLRNGRVVSSECLSAAGGPDRPFGDEVVMDKMAQLTASVYPRFPGVMQQIIELDQAQLARGWRDAVAEFCGDYRAIRA
jgi:2-methylcitrate dehydratase PrpD